MGTGRGVEARGIAVQPRLKCCGAQQATADAGEYQGDVNGAELTAVDGGVFAEAALAKCVGEEGGIVDELADEVEQTAGATGFGDWCWGAGHGG